MDSKETTYKKTYDGWFDFYYCTSCGHKEKELPTDFLVCPECGRPIKEIIND